MTFPERAYRIALMGSRRWGSALMNGRPDPPRVVECPAPSCPTHRRGCLAQSTKQSHLTASLRGARCAVSWTRASRNAKTAVDPGSAAHSSILPRYARVTRGTLAEDARPLHRDREAGHTLLGNVDAGQIRTAAAPNPASTPPAHRAQVRFRSRCPGTWRVPPEASSCRSFSMLPCESVPLTAPVGGSKAIKSRPREQSLVDHGAPPKKYRKVSERPTVGGLAGGACTAHGSPRVVPKAREPHRSRFVVFVRSASALPWAACMVIARSATCTSHSGGKYRDGGRRG